MLLLLGIPTGFTAYLTKFFLNVFRSLPAGLLQYACIIMICTMPAITHAETPHLENASTEKSKTNHDTNPQPQPSHIFKAGDAIKITVLGEPDLSRTYIMDERTTILIPWIGKVHLQDKTAPEIEKTLITRLKDGYMKNPIISVNRHIIKEAHDHEFYIMGAVKTPGRFDLPNNPPYILKAIAIAGGFTESANTQNFEVIRHYNGTNYKIRNNSTNALLQAGDIIIVKER